jgi:hypothetical protein
MGISIYVDDRTQAGRIIKRFGNARRLAALMTKVTGQKCDPSRIYRWMHPRDKGGTGGLIPSSAMEAVLACARAAGIILSAADLSPKPLPKEDEELPAIVEAPT